MLLTIDLGNTSLKLAVYDGNKQLLFNIIDYKEDDFVAIIKNNLYRNCLKEDMIEDCMVSSVVPSCNEKLIEGIKTLIGKEPIIIDPKHSYGIDIRTPNVDEVGSDILVMCAYAYHKFKKELLVVSIGTATVISHVSLDGGFCHCIISPGYDMVSKTLWSNAAKLPEFDLNRTTSFLANTTVSAMNVGIYQGFIGSLRYLLAGIRGELKTTPMVVACGGYGKEVINDIPEIEYYEADMVTAGLHYIYYRYIKNEIDIG